MNFSENVYRRVSMSVLLGFFLTLPNIALSIERFMQGDEVRSGYMIDYFYYKKILLDENDVAYFLTGATDSNGVRTPTLLNSQGDKIVRVGDIVDGATITLLNDVAFAVNDYGNVAFMAYYTLPSRSGHGLFSPTALLIAPPEIIDNEEVINFRYRAGLEYSNSLTPLYQPVLYLTGVGFYNALMTDTDVIIRSNSQFEGAKLNVRNSRNSFKVNSHGDIIFAATTTTLPLNTYGIASPSNYLVKTGDVVNGHKLHGIYLGESYSWDTSTQPFDFNDHGTIAFYGRVPNNSGGYEYALMNTDNITLGPGNLTLDPSLNDLRLNARSVAINNSGTMLFSAGYLDDEGRRLSALFSQHGLIAKPGDRVGNLTIRHFMRDAFALNNNEMIAFLAHFEDDKGNPVGMGLVKVSINDEDGDGIRTLADNCITTYNPDQTDSNEDGFGDSCVDPSVTIPRGADIQPDVVIEAGAIINQDVTIGSATEIGSDATIGKGSVIGDSSTIGDSTIVNQSTTIGDNCYIGRNVILARLVTIGKDCEIGDNSTIGQKVIIEDSVKIGSGVTIEQGAVIKVGAVVPNNAYIAKN